MAGIVNDVLYGLNADFTGGNSLLASESNGLINNGQLWIGSSAINAGGTKINVGSIVSPDSSVTIGYSSPNITLQVAGSGFGEIVSSFVPLGSAVSITPSTAVVDVTSINLTAGTWNISALITFSGTNTTRYAGSISTTSATLGTVGENAARLFVPTVLPQEGVITIPPWRLVTVGPSTTVYMVASATFSGSANGYGRISAIRVG